jgi:hypothetical protein
MIFVDRSGSKAAIPYYFRRDPLRDLALPSIVDKKSEVRMPVYIDESGANNAIPCIDHLYGLHDLITHQREEPMIHCHIALKSAFPCAVDHGTVFDQQIEHPAILPLIPAKAACRIMILR